MEERNSEPLQSQRAAARDARPGAGDAPELPGPEEIRPEASAEERAQLAPFLEDPCIASLYGTPVET